MEQQSQAKDMTSFSSSLVQILVLTMVEPRGIVRWILVTLLIMQRPSMSLFRLIDVTVAVEIVTASHVDGCSQRS